MFAAQGPRDLSESGFGNQVCRLLLLTHSGSRSSVCQRWEKNSSRPHGTSHFRGSLVSAATGTFINGMP